MGTSRVLVVALALSVSGNVALFCWARGRGDVAAPAPKAPPVASVPPSRATVTSRDPDPASTPPRPSEPAPTDGGGGEGRLPRPVPMAPVSVPMPHGLDWCGTGREDAPAAPLGPKWRLDEFDDRATSARMASDEEWQDLHAALSTTEAPVERLARMRVYLVARAGRSRRAEVAELAHLLGTFELGVKVPATWVVERLYLAAKALRGSVNENWLRHLDPPPPSEPAPSNGR